MQNLQSVNFNVNSDNELLAKQIAEDVEIGLNYLQNNQAESAIQRFKIALNKTLPSSDLHDLVTQNLLFAYQKHIQDLLNQQKFDVLNRYLPEVSGLQITSQLAHNKEFRTKFADTYKNLSVDFLKFKQHKTALYFIRRAISIEPCPTYYVDLTNVLAWLKSPAELKDYTTDYTEADIATHIFITCAPKSGSTFLKNVLAEITDYRDLFAVYASLQNEQEIDMPQLAQFGNVNTVTQQHARASEANIQIMQAFGISPVVLVRNIFDTVMSLVDFYGKGFTHSTFFRKEDYLNFDQETKINLIIEYAIPWYFQFVASWQRAERENRLEVYWISYENLIADKTKTIADILDFYGLSYSNEFIQQKIDKIESNKEVNRFNKGVSGRGKTALSKTQKDRIKNLAKYFPDIDFSLLFK